ncbi:MAG: hypothetical protein NT067_00565 [Candidatus Diapherotrites archaeon]|nr:hypothetical protein [Candidatus Diapherotrites archaeon]
MDKKLFIAVFLLAAVFALPFAEANIVADYRGYSAGKRGLDYAKNQETIPRYEYYCQKGSTKIKALRMFSTTWYSMKKDRLTGKITNSPCTYGCNKMTGKCFARKDINNKGDNFKWKCEGSFFYRNTRSVKINLDTGEIVEDNKCIYKCDSSTGQCRTV